MNRVLLQRRWRRGAPLLLFAAFLTLPVFAHDNPGDVIHALTHRMEEGGVTARLLTARAFEHTYAGNGDAAVEDFEAALALQPSYGTALSGLGTALLLQDKLGDAEQIARRGLSTSDSPDRRAPYHALLAQIHERALHWEEARHRWKEALAATRPEVDWFLGEAQCLAQLERYDERVAALAIAKTRNPSVVLHRAWIRALVDAHQLEQARREIEQNLSASRWKSTWLLLRAQVHAREHAEAAQHQDAEAALAELQARWGPDPATRDRHLLRDGATALELLGRPDAAQHLRDHGTLLEEVAREVPVADSGSAPLLATAPGLRVD